jgi:hypothetical protein
MREKRNAVVSAGERRDEGAQRGGESRHLCEDELEEPPIEPANVVPELGRLCSEVVDAHAELGRPFLRLDHEV